MAALDLGDVRAGRQPFGQEGADRGEHPRPRTSIAYLEADQAIARKRLGQVEGLVLIQVGNRSGGLDCPAVDEHGNCLEQRSLGVVEQAHAPIHGGPKRALALWQVHGAGSQHVERVSQPAQELVGIEDPDAGRGQLDRQRQALQTPADLNNRTSVVLGEGEIVAHSRGPVDKQRHRRR